jgi:hypothetical protein
MNLRGRGIAIASGIILLIAATLIFKFFPRSTEPAVSLSAIVLLGLALTVVFMAILAIVYKMLDVENREQPLGLPEGSVRALLAFSLVLIFVCLAAFLFDEVNEKCDNCGKTLSRANDVQLSDLKKDFIVAAEQAKDENGKLLYEQIPDPNDKTGKGTMDDLKHPFYTVTYYPKRSTDASDFAKQIFTTLATIFVSVVSFYFGSSVTSSAVGAGARAAQGTDADKKSAALQAALTSALADSHNAQVAAEQASASLAKAQAEASAAPSDQQKQAAVAAAQKALDDAKKDLQAKQATVQSAQKAVDDAKSKGGDSTTGQAKT